MEGIVPLYRGHSLAAIESIREVRDFARPLGPGKHVGRAFFFDVNDEVDAYVPGCLDDVELVGCYAYGPRLKFDARKQRPAGSVGSDAVADGAYDVLGRPVIRSVWIDGIPVDKIRRDPALHVVLRRENADLPRLMRVRGVKYAPLLTRIHAFSLAKTPSLLLMANPREISFELDLTAMQDLRKEGLVE